MKQKHNQHEAVIQQQLYKWTDYMLGKYPELALMYHIPNGGSRNKLEAANLKRQGVKAGVPDICLPVPKGKYHGLYIEMKYGKNKPTEKQAWWLKALSNQGYATKVCYSFDEATEVITYYLNLQNKG
ncbi:MAG: VRR-NUC domain-containing protein [Ruminococcus sp.]